jgi:hypothetical protein
MEKGPPLEGHDDEKRSDERNSRAFGASLGFGTLAFVIFPPVFFASARLVL